MKVRNSFSVLHHALFYSVVIHHVQWKRLSHKEVLLKPNYSICAFFSNSKCLLLFRTCASKNWPLYMQLCSFFWVYAIKMILVMYFYLAWCLIDDSFWVCILKDCFSLPSYWWTIWEKLNVIISRSSFWLPTTCRLGCNVRNVETVKNTVESAEVYTYRENVFH